MNGRSGPAAVYPQRDGPFPLPKCFNGHPRRSLIQVSERASGWIRRVASIDRRLGQLTQFAFNSSAVAEGNPRTRDAH